VTFQAIFAHDKNSCLFESNVILIKRCSYRVTCSL